MFERLDFSGFYSANKAEKEELCRKLVSNLKDYGFARLINHDVPPADIDEAFETSRQFFLLPLEEKMKSPHPATVHPHRGYSAIGIEKVSSTSNYNSVAPMPILKDMKESYDVGSEQDKLYANIWPPPGVHDSFQPAFTSFFLACYRAELTVLEAISIGLGLPPQTLSDRHADQSNELRLTHYPAASRGDFATATRIAAHTDFGTITLLFQDSVGGLQVEFPSGTGKFVDIESGGRHECIINVGDCLQKWAGLRSARHRVHLPEGPEGARTDDVIDARFSIAYFAKPDRAASLRPLIDDRPQDEGVYMTAGEFQEFRISGTY